MAAASLLSSSFPLHLRQNSRDHHRLRPLSSSQSVHCRVGPPLRSLPVVGSVGKRVEFTGLRMSSTEGLAKRIRDPQFAGGEASQTPQKASERVRKTREYVRSQLSKPGMKSLIVAIAIPFVLGSIDGAVNSPSNKWYQNLKKPWWQPPGPLFGGAWGILYPLMGLASWLVWAEGGFQKQGQALTLYAIQLVLNLLWPVFCFGWKNLGLALADIVALAVTLTLTIKAFKPANPVAANLMKPYLAWVLFATALNLDLYLKNRGEAPELKTE